MQNWSRRSALSCFGSSVLFIGFKKKVIQICCSYIETRLSSCEYYCLVFFACKTGVHCTINSDSSVSLCDFEVTKLNAPVSPFACALFMAAYLPYSSTLLSVQPLTRLYESVLSLTNPPTLILNWMIFIYFIYLSATRWPGKSSRYSEWLQAWRPSPGRVKNFLLPTSSRPVLGSTQPPILCVPGSLSPGVKRPGREADHSSPSSAEVKQMWIDTSTPPYAFMA
jgi:hypothetical protein